MTWHLHQSRTFEGLVSHTCTTVSVSDECCCHGVWRVVGSSLGCGPLCACTASNSSRCMLGCGWCMAVAVELRQAPTGHRLVSSKPRRGVRVAACLCDRSLVHCIPQQPTACVGWVLHVWCGCTAGSTQSGGPQTGFDSGCAGGRAAVCGMWCGCVPAGWSGCKL